MSKKLLFGLLCIALISVLFSGCKIVDSSISTGPVVKMGSNTFAPAAITVPKGQSLTFVDSVAVAHVVVNGKWQGTQQVPKQEAGAPQVNLSFSGNDTKKSGPFTQAGTYDIYCNIHQGMNLVVTVQ